MGARPGAYRNDLHPPAVGKAIAELAVRQHGVISTRQLNALGLDRYAISRRVEGGYLHPLHQRVYAVGHESVSWRGRCLAATMACGAGVATSHRCAADLWLLRRAGIVEVTVPHSRRCPCTVVAHRSRMMDPIDFTVIDGIPVTTVARTLLDLAAVLSPRSLGYAVDRAERLELFDLRSVDELLSRARGRGGAAALQQAIMAWRPRYTRRELEARHLELVSGAGLPEPQVNVLLDGELYTHEVDAFWPARRLVVQLDGFAYHRTRRDRERDATTDADLELAGYRVLRLTWDDVTVHGERTVRRLLTARGAATRE